MKIMKWVHVTLVSQKLRKQIENIFQYSSDRNRRSTCRTLSYVGQLNYTHGQKCFRIWATGYGSDFSAKIQILVLTSCLKLRRWTAWFWSYRKCTDFSEVQYGVFLDLPRVLYLQNEQNGHNSFEIPKIRLIWLDRFNHIN